MDQTVIDRSKFIATLMKIGHRDKTKKSKGKDLSVFTNDALPVAKADSELFARTLAWNHKNGKVRDSKIAFPVIALRGVDIEPEHFDNAYAHLASLGPRELLSACKYSKELTQKGLDVKGSFNNVRNVIKTYLEVRESKRGWWNKAVVSNRKAMKALYTLSHKVPAKFAQEVLFENKYRKGSIFDVIANLRNMEGEQAAAEVIKFKIPMQIAIGASGGIKNNSFVLALLENISGNELLNHSAMFERLGVMNDPILKTSYEKAVERAKDDKRVNILKASKASEKVDSKTAKKLKSIQDKKVEELGGIEGNWLIAGDRSGSMAEAIKISVETASFIASQVNGKVHLIFFDDVMEYFDITGKTLSEVQQMTKHVRARGATCIGGSIRYLQDKGELVNGIALVSDGGENRAPMLKDAYQSYSNKFGIEPTLYYFKVNSGYGSRPLNYDFVETLNWGDDVDYYSLPNIVKTLKTSRYALLDEIMKTPLLTLDEVFNRKEFV